MNRNKFIISLIGVYIFWLCFLPIILNKAILIVCDNLSHNSQYSIKIDTLKTNLSIIPVIKLSAKEIAIFDKNSSKNINIENAKVSFRILPLLSGTFHINKVNIDKIFLSADLIKKPELDKDFLEKLTYTKIKLDSIIIGEFNAKFYQKELNTPVEYKGKNFIYERRNQYLKLQNNSTLNIAGKVSKVTSNLYLPKNNDINKTVFDIEISNINLAPLKEYFKHYLPKDLKSLQGEVCISANKEGMIAELVDFAIFTQDISKSIIFPTKTLIKSKFNITRKYINFESIDIESKTININLNGKIHDYFSKIMPTLDLNIRINNSRTEDIIQLLPPLLLEEINIQKLKEYKFYGDTLANFSIKGRLPEPNIFGDIYINNGILIKPIPNTTKGATIKLNLNGKHINFDATVPAGNSEKVWVKGSQELYNIKYADLIVKSSQNVNLKNAQEVLIPLHEILNFIIGPLPIIDLEGNGNIDIIVKGNRKNPHIWGLFNTIKTKASSNYLPNLNLTNLDSTLNFNDQKVIFIKKQGLLNGKDFKINGTCDLSGKFDFVINTEDQPTLDFYNAILNSIIIKDYKKDIPQIDSISGLMDLNLNLYGAVRDINDIKLSKNVFAKGVLDFKDNNLTYQSIEIKQANGNVKFDNMDINGNITATIGNLPLYIKALTKNNFANIELDIPKFNSNLLIPNADSRRTNYLPYISLKSKYNGPCDKIDFSKLNLKALVINSLPNSDVKYSQGGEVNLTNGKIEIKNIKGYLMNPINTFDINLSINNAFNENINTNGTLNIKIPNINLINNFIRENTLPEDINKYIKDYYFQNGELKLNTKISNNKTSLNTDLAGISFIYKPLEIPIEIINGNLNLKNNNLNLDKINILADNMPILVDGEIKDIFNKKNFNLYFNSKPQQEFIDKYINRNQIYPIKIKGDIVYWAKIKGIPDNYDLKAQIDMSKDSSIYHFGATIGDIENAIVVNLDSKIIDNNQHLIKDFSYDKKIDSQSGRKTRLNMLKAQGGVKILKDDLIFNNLQIKTNHPTDARIFNIIFRKPNIKQGQFTSDLKINGRLSNAKVLGDFHIFETNIPFLDTTMKNIELVFKDKTIEFDSKGEVMGNEIIFDGVLKNKLSAPYYLEKASLYTKDLDLNQIVNKLKIAEVENSSTFESFEGFDLSTIVAKDFKLKAETVKLRNIHATDFNAITSITNKGVFNVNDFSFNIAQGTLKGNYSFNVKNNDIGINLNAESIDANDITWALFDLKDQIYGDLTGNINLTCNGVDFNYCMQTLNGNTVFNVKDGKMPKLGSLEYLLKAGNLVKGGLTGLSINSVIDLIVPSKTGDFSNIFGSIRIKDGIARNIEITTKGDDLNLFIGGTYNFSTSIAEMEVLGLLSRKISTMFGPIGNVSINTLFNVIPGVDLSKDSLILERINKIPGIELSSKAYRKFIAEIKGNINGDDYVTSFKWIN